MHLKSFYPNTTSKCYAKMYTKCVCCHSDSVESDGTLSDNSVQLQSIVQYEPDLFITRLVPNITFPFTTLKCMHVQCTVCICGCLILVQFNSVTPT